MLLGILGVARHGPQIPRKIQMANAGRGVDQVFG